MAPTTLYNKWRPRTFADSRDRPLVGQEPVARTLRQAIQRQQVAHAYLFCGPRGTGKTSAARIFARAVAAALVLAGCEADPIAARATLTELGFHGIALSRAPLTGRPCAWGEPFAVRYRAVTEDGRIVNGILCSADEATEDARLLPDAEGRS